MFGGSLKGGFRCCVVGLATAALAGCCAFEPYRQLVTWDVNKDDPRVAVLQKCFPLEIRASYVSPEQKIEGSATILERDEADAFFRLVELVKAGQTPTERDYTNAGCG